MIRRPPRSTPLYSSAASDVYKRQREDRELPCGGCGRGRRLWAHAIVKGRIDTRPQRLVEGIHFYRQARTQVDLDRRPRDRTGQSGAALGNGSARVLVIIRRGG